MGLCVLGLLGLHSAALGQEAAEVRPGSVLIFCDDPSVEKAVTSALDKFNEDVRAGYKLALFQILAASKLENGSDSVYTLQFTSRRSDCPAGGRKPRTDCNYLPHGNKKPLSCNATVLMTETETDTTQVDCLLDDYIVPEKASCLGCPVEVDQDSEELKVPLSVSISKYNSMSDSTHLFTFNSVGQATRQVVAGLRFNLRFDMRKSTCAKAEHKDLNELCVPDPEDVEFSSCNSTVDLAPWRQEPPRATVVCEAGSLPPILYSRRRPPGWTPLRSNPSEVSSSPPPLPPTMPPASPSTPPSKEAVKEESSEEDTTASKPSASPDGAAEAVNDNPFHCPSKPWKPFRQGAPAAPTEASLESAPSQPPVDGAFSDKDLVA